MDHLDAAEEAHLQSLTAAEADGDERAVEAALRPRTLDEVVGQHRVRDQLGLVLEATADTLTLALAEPGATVRPTATADSDRSTGPLMTSENSRPTTPMGSDPTPTARAKRQSSVVRPRREVSPLAKARTNRPCQSRSPKGETFSYGRGSSQESW